MDTSDGGLEGIPRASDAEVALEREPWLVRLAGDGSWSAEGRAWVSFGLRGFFVDAWSA